MSVPKPTEITNARIINVALSNKGLGSIELVDAVSKYPETPKPSAPRRERSAPVRNPAFREHEGLRELQKQLNSNGRKG